MDICVFCQSTDNEPMYPTYDLWNHTYMLKRCHSCHAVFLTPVPDAERLALAYDETYYGCTEKKFQGPVEKALDYFRKQRARRISKLIPQKGSILDIGCGNGHFLMSLKTFGDFSLHGAELKGKSAERAAQHKEINLTTDPITPDTYPLESMDVVTLFHVFEHLTQPSEMLNIIRNVIKPGGTLIMSFPNIGSWQSRFFKGKWLHLDPPRHLFFFEKKHLVELMKSYGFEITHISTLSSEQNPYGFIQSLLNTFITKREVLFENLKGNTQYTSDFSSFSLLMQKMFFALVFPFAIVGDLILAPFKKGATITYRFIRR